MSQPANVVARPDRNCEPGNYPASCAFWGRFRDGARNTWHRSV